MEHLLDSLEQILDDINNPDYEVEYSVSGTCQLLFCERLGPMLISNASQEWCSDPQAW